MNTDRKRTAFVQTLQIYINKHNEFSRSTFTATKHNDDVITTVHHTEPTTSASTTCVGHLARTSM